MRIVLLFIPRNCCCLACVFKSNQSVVKRLFSLEGAILHTIFQQLLYIPQIYFVKVVARTTVLFLRIQNPNKNTLDVPLYTVTLHYTLPCMEI
jgi:hypothetical protein